MKTALANGALAGAALVACALAAWSVSQFGWQPSHRLLLPFIFLAVVLVLGFRYGRLVGILGSIISALIFAFALYQPVGSFAVTDMAARSSLAWAILAGVSASFLLLPAMRDRHHRK